MNNKIKRIEFDSQPNNVKEKKEETNSVLMHAKELLEYSDKIIKAFEKGIFLFEQEKKIKNTGDFVVEEVSSFIQKIKSKLKNINLSLFNEFLESF